MAAVTMGYRARSAVLLVAGLGLLWLSLANTAPLVLGSERPAFATGLGLGSAKVQGALAMSALADRPGPGELSRASRLAQAALRREPVNVKAAVALGTVALLRHQTDLGRRLFAYSERISRHEPAAQLWLIEDHVARGDIRGALVHYDRLMRVSPSFRPTLIPILVSASGDPAIAEPLAELMAGRPNWWQEAIGPLIFQTPDPVRTVPLLLRRLRLRPEVDAERALLSAAMIRLASAGAFAQAHALYLASGGTRPADRDRVRDGGFEGASRLAPFDWDLVNADGRTAVVQPRPDGAGNALFLYADQDRQGELARQLVLLSPGRYRLSIRSGNITGDVFQRPQARILCATRDARSLLDLRLPVSADAGQNSAADFTVPAACPAQWLSLASGSVSGAQDGAPWVDAVRVQPLE